MSVPRRLGAGHSDFDNGTGTCALQSRHPSGFDSDKSMDGVNGHPHTHTHTYTNGLSSTSSTHIAANQLSTLSINGAYSPSPSVKSPHTSFSIASTASTPSTPSPSSTFSFTSPCPSSSTASPASHLPPLHATAQATSTSPAPSALTIIQSFSSTATLSSNTTSPNSSPSPLTRRPSMLKPSQSPSPSSNTSSSPLRFASPFRSHKQTSSPHIQNEAINAIMQEESPPSAGSPNGQFKSPGSPRALPSPKPSPGVRAQVASPAPTPSSSPSAVVAYNQLPAIDRVHRYVVTGTLQQSLFGVVKLAFDRVCRQLVAIKISRRERAQQQTTRSGVSVLENVRREAAVMQYLHDRSASGTSGRWPERKKSLYAEMLAHMTGNGQDAAANKQLANGGGSSSNGSMGGKKVKRMSSRATTQQRVHGGDERMNIDDDSTTQQPINVQCNVGDSDGETSDSDARMSTPSLSHRVSISTTSYEPSSSHTPSYSSSQSSYSPSSSAFSTPQNTSPTSGNSSDHQDVEGERYICRYVEELEDEYFHYLVTEFVPAGDLYSMLTSFPQHRLTEGQARGLFRQMVLGVKYLHVRNVAHLDMSLENMCLDMDDCVRIIDFGVSALHPFTPTAYQTNYFSFPSASSPISFPSSISSPNSNNGPNSSITPPNQPTSTSASASSDFTPHPHRSFLCKPVKELYAKPGKIRYMSPELFQGLAWDAYANDVFSLGVILYSLLTGRPPFQQAEATDVWFHVIYSGQWLQPNIRKQSSAHVYTHLSEPALQLINFILKPQERRPTCEQILQHPWMQL